MNMKSEVRIGTHNGAFHSDEITACALLRQLPEYSSAKIIRTRDPKELDACDIVVDVGGVFDPAAHRYDHHQRDFNLTFRDFFPDSKWDIRLSSAGLTYVHFGKRILETLIKRPSDDLMIDALFRKIYAVFIVEIDAIDNGVDISDDAPRYQINTDISSRVGMMNPVDNSDEERLVCFHKALTLVENELLMVINHYAERWYPALPEILQSMKDRFSIDPSGAIIFLQKDRYIKSCVNEIDEYCRSSNQDHEDKTEQFRSPLFSLSQRYDGTWSVTAIPEAGYRFKQRLSLPEEWRGLRDQELCDKAGFPECVFVHASGFLGVHRTREGAIKMAKLAIKKAGLDL